MAAKKKPETAAALDKKRRKRRKYPEGKRTRVASEVRRRDRLPPPVPEGKTLEEIKKMDPDSPAFKHRQGRKRKRQGKKISELHWKEAIREDRQRKARARRAKVRKWEAEVVVAANENDGISDRSHRTLEVYDEDRLIQDGVLSIDDWDEEELSRGYRRGRDGRFGNPPKYIPREIQQEAFRRLVKRGDRHLRESYIQTIRELVDLAHNADSEKVRLEAVKEIMNRLVGKVPEHLKIAPESPFEDYLADALVPVEEVPALDIGPGAVDAPSTGTSAAATEEEDGVAPAPGSPDD